MNSDLLRKFKHELRTPVNHILGYSDLLLETAADSGDAETAELAKDIHDNGQVLAKLLEKNLLSASGKLDLDQMEALRAGVRPVIKEILSRLGDRTNGRKDDQHAHDLGRIRRAVDQLLTLVETEGNGVFG
jgi:K+-sensing histidine kinase KdpD